MAVTRTMTGCTFTRRVELGEMTVDSSDPTVAGGLPASIVLGDRYGLTSTSTPAVTKSWHSQVTLSAGAKTLDLTALVDQILGTVSMSGLKLISLDVVADQANTDPITIAPGAIDGYTGWAAGLTVGPGDIQSLGPLHSTIAIDGTHKSIDLASVMAAAKATLVMTFG